MKPIIVLLILSFYQIDRAIADEGLSGKIIEQRMEQAAKLTLLAPKFPPRFVGSFSSPMVQKAPLLSCDVTVENSRQDVRMDYSCDAIKTLKAETLAIAAN